MNLLALSLAAGCFLAIFALIARAWRGGDFRPAKWQAPVMAGAFVLLTVALHLRGREIGRCPVTSLGEVFVFLSWATVLLYLVVGQTYRFSLMGAFTAPLALALLGAGMLLPPGATPVGRPPRPDAWLELHAAVSLMAYGAFALAAVAGAMWLVQDAQLKSRRPHPIVFQLPPLTSLGAAHFRLIVAGWLLLSLGLAAGFLIPQTAGQHTQKILLSLLIWLAYGAIALLRHRHILLPRHSAICTLAAFAASLATLWGIEFAGGQ